MGGTGRLLWISAAAATFAALLVLAASASAAPLAYVANTRGNSISVMETATSQVVGEAIPVGSDPFSIAFTPDGRFAYVVNRSDSTVSVIETASRQTVGRPISVGEDPTQIAMAPDGEAAWVADEGSDELSVIDTQTNQVVTSILVDGYPWGVSFTPDGKLAYVPLYNSGAVEVFETSTGRRVGRIPVGAQPFNVTFDPSGKTAYVVNHLGDSVTVIDTATRRPVTTIPVGEDPWGFAISPDGSKALVANGGDGTVSVIDPALDQVVRSIPVGEEPAEIAITPNGRLAYVTDYLSEDVVVIDTARNAVIGSPIQFAGKGPHGVAIAPDLSPTAAFTAPSATAGVPAAFNGAASTDPDGSVASWSWAFGDGGTAVGSSVDHTYQAPGTYAARLSVVDDEGCGEAEVFTGRGAYCSGSAPAVRPVVASPPVVLPPSNHIWFGRVIHNRRNGTVRLQVRLPGAGSVFLFGRKVHAVKRKSKGVQTMWLTLHARVELNKRLKKIHRARVRFRVTFTPDGGTARTVHRSAALLRAPGPRHRRHDEHRRS